MSKVRVLYDFDAENANELTCHTGETLNVMNSVVYDGWIQVKNATGSIGIVPSSYVEYLDDEDDIPPPPSAKGASSYGGGGGGFGSSWEAPAAAPATASWNTPAPTSSYVNATSYSNSSYQNQNDQSFDTSSFDEFDPFGTVKKEESLPTVVETPPVVDSFSAPRLPTQQPESGFDDLMWSNPPPSYGGAAAAGGATAAATNSNTQQGRVNKNYDDDSDFDSDDDASTRTGTTTNNNPARSNILSNSVHNVTSGIGTLTKSRSKNPYSLEAFLLHGAIKNVHDSDRFSSIVINEQRQSNWKRISPPYQVSIIGYQADKKYHGVKKFTSYEIKASCFPQRVKRRYNHFDWLHERLSEKYPNICIPPLSGKAVTGNFDEDFIAKRKAALELWLNRMSAHPVVGQSEVFIHFLQCDDGSAKWKAGKRKAEKDEYRGAQWFCTLTVPGESVDTTTGIKERVDKFSKAAAHMNSCVKNISVSLDKVAANNSSFYKKELSNLGKRFEELGITLSNDSLDAVNNSKLSTAFVSAGNCYTQLGNMYGEQAKHDIYPFLDRLQLYQGVLQQMPDIAQIEKSAIQLYEEFQQRPEKLEGRSLMEVAPRREIISHVTFAEINHFNREKVEDLTQYMKSFLQQQVQFYSEITECLKRAQAEFDKIPVFSSNNQAAANSSFNNQSFKR